MTRSCTHCTARSSMYGSTIGFSAAQKRLARNEPISSPKKIAEMEVICLFRATVSRSTIRPPTARINRKLSTPAVNSLRSA